MPRAPDLDFSAFAAARLPSLMRYALAVSGDLATAEDLVQAALLRTALRWNSMGTRTRLRPTSAQPSCAGT